MIFLLNLIKGGGGNYNFYTFACIEVGIYRISENVSIIKFYQNIHVHIAYCHCARDQIEYQTPKMLVSRFKFILMTILTVVLFLKRRLLKIVKSPVLSTGGKDNSKSRYGNDLKCVMAFLDR